MRIIVGFLIVTLTFIAIPAHIVLFIARATSTENNLRIFRNQMGDVEADHRASGSAPHIFARTPSIFLLCIAAVSGITAWHGLSSLIEENLDLVSFKASIMGVLIFLIAVIALFIKHREINAARHYAKTLARPTNIPPSKPPTDQHLPTI